MSRSIVIAACARVLSAPEPALAAQTGDGNLAYAVPDGPSGTYHIADTLVTSMDTPTGSIDIDIATSATLATAFEADPEGVRVTATLQSLSTTMTNPMPGSQTLAPEAIGGHVFVLSPRGNVKVLSTPEVEGPAGSTSFRAVGHGGGPAPFDAARLLRQHEHTHGRDAVAGCRHVAPLAGELT